MILPNQLTILRIVLTPVFLFLFLADDPTLKQISIVVFFVAAITDWYDGWLARKFNYITNWGKFLDPLADKILTSAAFFAFAVLNVLELWMVLIIVIRDFLITFLRIYAEYQKFIFSTSKSAQWKTFIQMAFIYYLLAIYTLMTIEPVYSGNEKVFEMLTDPIVIYYVMLFVTVFTFYTGILYIYKIRFLIKRILKVENKRN
jgi:CDP-diacylglycerol--glycerol-3-phosphate 3-phosphatidyltransferase